MHEIERAEVLFGDAFDRPGAERPPRERDACLGRRRTVFRLTWREGATTPSGSRETGHQNPREATG